MTTITGKEFTTNQKKYFDLAINEDVCIKRGKNIFFLICNSVDETNVDEDMIFEPDDDLRRSISMDELRESVHEHIHKLFAKK